MCQHFTTKTAFRSCIKVDIVYAMYLSVTIWRLCYIFSLFYKHTYFHFIIFLTLKRRIVYGYYLMVFMSESINLMFNCFGLLIEHLSVLRNHYSQNVAVYILDEYFEDVNLSILDLNCDLICKFNDLQKVIQENQTIIVSHYLIND